MVAILMAGGVLLGFVALVIDVGQLYLERQQLQSGADSAALAVAKACAIGASQCATQSDILTLAGSLANLNAADGRSNLAEVCGNVPGGLLPPCGVPVGNMTDCLTPAPTDGSPFVEVHTSTETLDGKFVLPPVFAQTMSGNEGYTGSSVGACARATWQSTVDVLLMTISDCEFNADTANGTFTPETTSITAANEHSISYWQDPFDDSHCPVDPPPPYGTVPFTGPGTGIRTPVPGQGQAAFIDSFGCSGTVPVDGNVHGYYLKPKVDTILSVPCENVLRPAVTSTTTVYVPVYDTNNVLDPNSSYPGLKADADFHIEGLAPFVVTGFEFAPPPDLRPSDFYQQHNLASYLTGRVCSEALGRCFAGVFTGPLLPLTSVIPSNNTIVKLVG
jgi:hypothetical protein